MNYKNFKVLTSYITITHLKIKISIKPYAVCDALDNILTFKYDNR